MDSGQKVYTALAVMLVLWLGWRQAHASGGSLPRRGAQATAQAVMVQASRPMPPAWAYPERSVAEFQGALAAQSSQLLLSSADMPRFLDEKAAQLAVESTVPFAERLNGLETAAASTFVRLSQDVPLAEDGDGGGGGVVVVGTSARGRTYPSSRSSSSSYSHK